MPPRILHIITGLSTGGAEEMLRKLILYTKGSLEHRVISLTDIGSTGNSIKAQGIPVEALNLPRGPGAFSSLTRLSSAIKKGNPHIIQTWMYHADLLGGLAAVPYPAVPVIWNIRQSSFSRRLNGVATTLTASACSVLSWLIPEKIICCSHAARRFHASAGYRSSKMVVIQNGFDTDKFRPLPHAGKKLREKLGISHTAPVIGMAARTDPAKDHPTFLKAAGIMLESEPDTVFMLCGQGTGTMEFKTLVRQAGLARNTRLLGDWSDMPEFMNALDIFTLSSVSEGFPNVTGEAMSCGVPCVVTDAGDSRLLTGDTGVTVPPGDPGAIASAWKKLVQAGPEFRKNMGLEARRRIQQEFSMEKTAAAYRAVYTEACGRKACRAGRNADIQHSGR